ncbi:MAG TPA: mycofactocin precursor MftA [Candidatus Dormibacteraeota bacterium]|jgi:mycofactocin precursor|nr:mycofactocin precursor MftA [Candidatus Dormibacteraeota bacterium]
MITESHPRREGTPVARPAPEAMILVPEDQDEPDYGAELSDQELGRLLVREVTIDGMCGVY